MKNKVVLITGAGSGMGKAAAILFARQGANVALADLNEEAIRRVAERINTDGGKAITVKCDVTDEEQVKAVVEKTVKTFGKLDAAYNNAGIQIHSVETADMKAADFDRIIFTNLKSIWLCLKYELRQMLQNGGGAIVNNSSIAGIIGSPTRSAYGAAKHGILGLTKTAAAEYGSRGIRVNAVCPGTINTPMVFNMLKNGGLDREAALEATPMHRFADPEEVASVVLFLCSDAASYVNGQALAVDGGQTII